MSRNIMTAAPELQTWAKDLQSFQSTYQNMLQRLQDLDSRNQELEADLLNETQSRRTWMKRAQDVEGRVAQQQYILLLIDGNQTCFRDTHIRSGTARIDELVDDLVTETRALARQQHKNDLAEDISTVIQMFLDVDRLAQDLMAAGSISNKQQLQSFFRALSATQPLVTVVDCGTNRAVDAQIKAYYELSIENCQCRHIMLALGHDSEYYATLDMYSEDAFTKSKTSLVKPEGGFPVQYSLPFHVAQFSSLSTVRLISFSEIASEVNEPEPESETLASPDLRSLSNTLPFAQRSDASSQSTKPGSLIKSSAAGSSSEHSQHVVSSDTGKAQSRSSKSSQPDAPKSSASSAHQKPPSASASISRPSIRSDMIGKQAKSSPTPSSKHSGRPVSPPVSDRSQKPGSKISSQSIEPIVSRPPQTSAYEEEMSSLKNEWERQIGVNSYAPPPIMVPWGEEVVGGNNDTIDTSNENAWPDLANSRKQKPNNRRKPVQQAWGDTNYTQNHSAHNDWETYNPVPVRTEIQSFDGGWDDHVAAMNGTATAPMPSAASPSRTNGDTDMPARPITSAIGLNRSRQRIDLPLPSANKEDWERYAERVKHSGKLCNEHHLRLLCHDKVCRYDHNEIDAGLLLVLRHVARTSPCDIGPACRRHECYSAHRCPFQERSAGCRKPECAFRRKGLHNIGDLRIDQTIPVP